MESTVKAMVGMQRASTRMTQTTMVKIFFVRARASAASLATLALLGSANALRLLLAGRALRPGLVLLLSHRVRSSQFLS